MYDIVNVYWTNKNNEKIDISAEVGELKWKEDNEGHTMELSFSLPDTDERYLEHYMIEAGDKIQFIYKAMPSGEVKAEYCFEVTEAERSYPMRKIKAKDFCMFFEENDIVIQLKDMSVKRALETVFGELGAEADIEAEMSASVNGVYIDTAEEIIEELIDIQQLSDGQKYTYEMTGQKVRVYRLGEETEYYRVKPAENVAEYNASDEHTRLSYMHSIEGMRNSVKAIIKSNTEENMPAVEYTVTDSESVARYGKFESKIEVSADKQLEIEVLAKNELKDKNKLKREVSCEMPGAVNARVNRVMHIVDEYMGIDALMRITQCEHSITGGIYKMNIGLEYLREYEAESTTESKIVRENIDLTGKSATYYDNESGDTNFDRIYAIAQKYMGVPYVWGGYSPKGFDCSGFVCYVLREAGVYSGGRTTAQGLYNTTKRVKSPQAGDLVFWTGTNPNSTNFITHVGICIGGGKNIQAGGQKVHVGSNSGAYAYGRFGK